MRSKRALLLAIIIVAAIVLYSKQAKKEFTEGMTAYESSNCQTAFEHFDRVTRLYRLASSSNTSKAQTLKQVCQVWNLVEEKSFLAALDAYTEAKTTFKGNEERVALETAYQAALAGLATDMGVDGQRVILETLETACQRQPAASSAIGITVDSTGLQLCPDVGEMTLPEEWIAHMPGSLKYVVAVETKTSKVGECGPYTPFGQKPLYKLQGTYLNALQESAEIDLINAQTGEVIDSTRVDGPLPACPGSIDFGRGAVLDPISAKTFQYAMIDWLSPLLPTVPGLPRVLKAGTRPVLSIAFSPDGKWLASASEDTVVKLWDVSSGQEVRTLAGHTDIVDSVAFSPDGKWLASASEDTVVKLWDVSSGQEVRTLEDDTRLTMTSIAFSPDGKQLAWVLYDVVKLWDVSSGQEVRTLTGHKNGVTSVAFAPDGTLLASGSWDQTVKLWDVSSGQEVRTLGGSVENIAFSPDGKWLASASFDVVKLWDVASGQEVRTLTGHTDMVSSVAFAPDGTLLASGSWDQTVKLWDVSSGQEVRTLESLDNVTSVAFSADGALLASGSSDGIVILWQVKQP